MRLKLVPLLALNLSFMLGAVADAAEGRYVFCDNGLRCVKAPCPSSNALDLDTGALVKGVSIDTTRLPEKDKGADLPDRLFAGKLVLRGVIERRTITHTGKEYDLPYLVATAVERASTRAERARCSAR
jgi:hypothetical protein